MTIPQLKIKGGKPLKGEVKIAGAKNATTKLLVASLLTDKKCIFYNVPDIIDVDITLSLCREIGMVYAWDKVKKILEVQTKYIKTSYISQKFSGANRIPILLIGALLNRTNSDIVVPTIGGDNLGKRPVDFHIYALKQLGVNIEYREIKKQGAYFAQVPNKLKGSVIDFPYPSVGATENAILAAVGAEGKTIIKNIAIEPEIIDFILFLQKLGVNIFFNKDREVIISQTKTFNEVTHSIIYDRNEIASYASAAISTKGNVFLRGAHSLNMISFWNKIRAIGGHVELKEEGVNISYRQPLIGSLHIQTDVHPGFMTDWQQPFAVALTQSKGISIIHETVYEKRFGYIKILNEMGAEIYPFTSCLGNKLCRFNKKGHIHSIVIKGATPLKAKNIAVPDLRAGFAYIIAALIAEGESVLSNVHFLIRGYENFVFKLLSLGAEIGYFPDYKNITKQTFLDKFLLERKNLTEVNVL